MSDRVAEPDERYDLLVCKLFPCKNCGDFVMLDPDLKSRYVHVVYDGEFAFCKEVPDE
jgi:hypothetical protein